MTAEWNQERKQALKEHISNPRFWVLSLITRISSLLASRKGQKKELAEKLQVSQSAVSQLLIAEGDHKVSTVFKAVVAMGYVPHVELVEIDQYVEARMSPYTSLFQQCRELQAKLDAHREIEDVVVAHSSERSHLVSFSPFRGLTPTYYNEGQAFSFNSSMGAVH